MSPGVTGVILRRQGTVRGKQIQAHYGPDLLSVLSQNLQSSQEDFGECLECRIELKLYFIPKARLTTKGLSSLFCLKTQPKPEDSKTNKKLEM